MKYILIGLLLIIFIRVIIGTISIKIEADNDRMKVSLKFLVWYINIFKIDKKENKIKKKKNNKKATKRKLQFDKVEIFKISKYYIQKFRKTKIDYMKLDASIGLDDAAITAILGGVLSAFLYTIIPILFYKMNRVPDINIQPNFNEKVFKFKFFCILRIKITHIINALWKLRYMMNKRKVVESDGK